MSMLGQSVIFLGAAVVAVPISKRFGLGAVLGYLAAGAIIGPAALGLIEDFKSILHFAELGVVPRSVVSHSQLDVVVARAHIDADLDRRPARLDAVAQQVGEHLVEHLARHAQAVRQVLPENLHLDLR